MSPFWLASLVGSSSIFGYDNNLLDFGCYRNSDLWFVVVGVDRQPRRLVELYTVYTKLPYSKLNGDTMDQDDVFVYKSVINELRAENARLRRRVDDLIEEIDLLHYQYMYEIELMNYNEDTE